MHQRHAVPVADLCDANMEPGTFSHGKWLYEKLQTYPFADQRAQTEVQEEGMYDYVVACEGLKTNIRQVELIEEYESRRSARSNNTEGPEAILPGVSGGKVPLVEHSDQSVRNVFSKKKKQKQVLQNGRMREKQT